LGVDRSGGEATPGLRAAEHNIDTALAWVAALVVFDGDEPESSAGNAGRYALCSKGVLVPVCTMAAVARHPLRPWQIIEQRGSAGVVADLASSHEEAEQSTLCIGDGVQLDIYPAFGVTYTTPKAAFLTKRLAALGVPSGKSR
jgi:hypothetical protein